ncbi:MAG: hypothetical protein DMG01_16305, partial [Acidobacteria bacterium]
MRLRALILAIAIAPFVGVLVTPAASNGTACANLAALTIPNVTIRSATAMAAGVFTPPGGGTARLELQLPA